MDFDSILSRGSRKKSFCTSCQGGWVGGYSLSKNCPELFQNFSPYKSTVLIKIYEKMKSRTDKAQIRFENEKLAPQPGLLLTSFKFLGWNIQDLGLDINKIYQFVGGRWVGCPFKTSSSVLPWVGGSRPP